MINTFDYLFVVAGISTSTYAFPFKSFKFILKRTFKKIKSISIPQLLLSFTLLLLGLKSENQQVYNIIQILFLSIGLLVVGIPHGAIDNIVESGNINERFSFSFVFKYISIALVYFILWMILPNISLLLFLVYSAWHFGQSDMQEWKPKQQNNLVNFVWGTTLLGIILLGHVSETNNIISSMGTHTIPLKNISGRWITLSLSIFAICWGIYKRNTSMVITTITLFISMYLPLFTSFGLYFIGQHSITGWSHLKTSLKTDNLSLFKKVIPFNIGALLLFAIMLLNINNTWITSFFILLSCLSLPHVYIMNSFYLSIKENRK